MCTVDWIEVAKIVAPLAAAIFGVWLTVHLALKRYKSERIWERRIAAFADLISAIHILRRDTAQDYDDLTSYRSRSEEYDLKQKKLVEEAMHRLAEASSIAALLLPKEVKPILEKMGEGLARRDQDWDWEEYLGNRLHELDVGSAALVTLAKDKLGIPDN